MTLSSPRPCLRHRSRVERVLHYGTLPAEAPLLSVRETAEAMAEDRSFGLLVRSQAAMPVALRDIAAPPSDWPRRGDVRFRDVVMRYRDNLEPVLKGVTFTVTHGQKIGIVGR